MVGKARIVLIRLSAEWFDSVVASPELVHEIRQDGEHILNFLAEIFEIQGTWQVNNQASLEACCKYLYTQEVDIVLLVFQVWAEDFYLHALTRAFYDHPVVVWCYQPWSRPPRPANFIEVLRGSGPVGTMEGLGTLKNLGIDYQFVYGAPGEKHLVNEFTVLGQAARVRSQLLKAHFGLLPYRNDQMHSTFVDEFRLRSELGPSLQYLSVAELQSSSQQIPIQEVDKYVHHLKAVFPIKNVTEQTLNLAARTSLGLISLGQDHNLDLLSLNDIAPELHATLGLRPCLIPARLSSQQPLVTLEGDLGAATAAYILSRLTEEPLLFCEMWFWDETDNLVTLGHAGPQDPKVARPGSVTITQDFEFRHSDATPGAHYQFVAKPGRIILLHLRATQKGWQAILTSGECVDLPSWVEGYPHAILQLTPSVEKFLNAIASVGSTQHWILAYGDHSPALKAFFRSMNIPLLQIE